MKQTNEIITIASSELLVSTKAKAALDTFMASIRKKYRLDKTAQNELNIALRDVLLEQRRSASSTITEKLAQQAIEMVGDSYDDRKAYSKITTFVLDYFLRLKQFFSSKVLTESFRKKMFYAFALVMLAPIGLLISSLSYFQYNPQPTIYDHALQTTMGNVTLSDWDEPTASNNTVVTTGSQNDKNAYMGIAVFAVLCALMITLAHRSPYAKLCAGMLIVALVASYGVAKNNEAAFQYAVDTNMMSLTMPISTKQRPLDAYDRLNACGAQINYVMGEQQGSIYYGLKDKGFTLGKELQNAYPNQAPTRQELCNTYDELRATHSNENIVLLTFVRDDKGEVLPLDSEQLYGEFATKETKNYEIKYGFFVK